MGAQRGMNAPVRTYQLGIVLVPFRVVVTGTTPSLVGHLGQTALTVSRTSAGIYVLTLAVPARKAFITGGAPISETADLKATSGTPSRTAITYTFTNNSGVATDPAAFAGIVCVHDDIVLRG